ncbi:MAG: argininosuccinate lyase [Calditrichaeota bacterium]|nr:argininosuccinate lyase [Calditrichota bacterium]
MKLWQKGIAPAKNVEEFTVGNDYVLDQQLLKYDCIASAAHARMLHKIKILSDNELESLLQGLKKITELDASGKFKIKASDEDCHTAIENYLTAKLGDVGKKIHTGRSRNDQVLTALRLYYRDELNEIDILIDGLQKAFRNFGGKYKNVAIPGFTHTRKAMPSGIKMWSDAFADAAEDNKLLVQTVLKTINQSPLGTAAGYGVPLNLDREFTANELGFDKVQQNPVYAQLSRGKFESLILHSLSQIMFDLNRCAADLIFLSMPDWGIFLLPAEYCTGSSIMPQKMNPDVLELVRSNYHIVNSYQNLLQNITANLISGYHRDIQNSKEAVLKSFQLTKDCLTIMTSLIAELAVDTKRAKEHMTDELYATEKAYKLVEQGVPFRDAYRQVAKDIFKDKSSD